MGDWRDPGFLERAHGWIEEQLTRLGLRRTGEIEQSHVALWSTVLRVPVEEGPVWFKANMPGLAHEAALVEHLSARRPDAVPPLLAADVERGWMLLADAGEPLRTVVERERDLGRWLDVLPLYAGVQLDLSPDVDELLALGVPDLRLAALPALFEARLDEIGAEQRFRDAVPRVRALCDELAAYGVAETIQHDDLHDAQVFVRDGRHLLLDWGDACVSHPFFTLAVTLEGVLAWGLDDVEGSLDTTPFRDAYLAPFAARYGDGLAEAVPAALRLGWVCRAVNGHVPGDDGPTNVRLRMFLDGTPG